RRRRHPALRAARHRHASGSTLLVTTVISFVVVIGILILVHELGHFLVARWTGVGVERFSIGFGPVLARWRGKETEYCLSAIPLGGDVEIVGEENATGGRSRAGRLSLGRARARRAGRAGCRSCGTGPRERSRSRRGRPACVIPSSRRSAKSGTSASDRS